MTRLQRPVRPTLAFTLIELLIVIAIIALLISILLPALGQAREQSYAVKCMANFKQIGAALYMYRDDKGEGIPWIHPWPNWPNWTGWASQFVWGGFIAPQPDPFFGNTIDYMKWDAEARPLNPYIDAQARGKDQIDIYKCPGDKSRGFALLGGGNYSSDADDWLTSWKAAGNSYAVNWWWMNYYLPGGFSIDQMPMYSPKLLRTLQGGTASTFIVFYESLLHPALQDATMSGGGIQFRAWHRQWSKYSVLFLDGHSEYRYMDTRYPRGTGWTVWAPR